MTEEKTKKKKKKKAKSTNSETCVCRERRAAGKEQVKTRLDVKNS